jgi:hypothetical protein
MIRYAGYVPAHDEIEEKLAAALVPHDLAAAASAAQGEKATRPAERPPSEVARPRVKVKLHILALLTVVTVIPLGLLMIWLPLYEVMPGNDREQGTMAWDVRNNQEAVRAAILSIFGVKPNDQTENPQIKSNQVQPAAGEQHLRSAGLVRYGPKSPLNENPARRNIPL